MVFGVIIMVASGLLEFALTPNGFALQFLAFAFGAGVALTLDEFALVLHLEDVYWQEQGRVSVDAVIVAASAGRLTFLVGPPLTTTRIAGASGWLLAVIVAVDLTCSIISILKGKLWTGFIGIWVPIVAQIGAMPLRAPARPGRADATPTSPRGWPAPRCASVASVATPRSSRDGSTT
jgi:hypothetical protein